MKNGHKRSLYDIEVMALDLGLGGKRVEDEDTCKKICDDFRNAFLTNNSKAMFDILRKYILKMKIVWFDGVKVHLMPDTGVLFKYEAQKDNLHIAFEIDTNADVKIESPADILHAFKLMERREEDDLPFAVVAIYTNEIG